jgi:hypothetical protein
LAELEKKEKFLKQQGKTYGDMKNKFAWLIEYKNILTKLEEVKQRKTSDK